MESIETSSRRDFLLAAGLGAAAVVAVVGMERRKPVVATKVAAERLHGYRASPHIMKYYKTTEV
jgi:hypothetical protein